MTRLLLWELVGQKQNFPVRSSRPATRLSFRGSGTDAVGLSAAGTAQMQQCGGDFCWSIFATGWPRAMRQFPDDGAPRVSALNLSAARSLRVPSSLFATQQASR